VPISMVLTEYSKSGIGSKLCPSMMLADYAKGPLLLSEFCTLLLSATNSLETNPRAVAHHIAGSATFTVILGLGIESYSQEKQHLLEIPDKGANISENLMMFQNFELVRLQMAADAKRIFPSRNVTSLTQANVETSAQNAREDTSFAMPPLAPVDVGSSKSIKKAPTIGVKLTETYNV
jgi:hypothetical protein